MTRRSPFGQTPGSAKMQSSGGSRSQSASSKTPKVIPLENATNWFSGAFGSRDCVLQFRLSALHNTGYLIAGDDQPVIDTPPKSTNRQPGYATKVLEPSNHNTPKKSAVSSSVKKVPLVSSGDKGLLKKRTHESFSSSDNSISSSCDDPPDGEYDRRSPGPLDGGNCSKEPDLIEVTPVTPKSRNNVVSRVSHKTQTEKENKLDLEPPVDASEMPARRLLMVYRFANTETRLLRRILNSHGLVELEDATTPNLLWTGSHVKTDVLRGLQPYQRINHFPRSHELTRKDRLYKNIEKMQHLRGVKQFNIVPMSFMLPNDYRDLVSMHRTSPRMAWIVKPAASSRGRGIFLVHSPDQIPADEQVIVSRYIANPLCIDGHKCDIRLYVAVTSFDPLLIYMYEEGLVRLATVKYDKNVENLWNPCMHLCNYSINKYHSDYIKATESCEDVGHKWTFSALLRHLHQQGSDTKELMSNIEDIVIKSILACTQSIAAACRMFVPSGNNCFELYGYDILIDDQLKPWLLEVNMSPSLGIDTPLDTKVKASVITDLLTLVGIPAIDASTKVKSNQPKWSRYRNAAGLGKCRKATSTPNFPAKKPSASGPCFLTQEELRIVRHAQDQYNRRGGFVRIFPTADSMQKYGTMLDPVTGIPISTPNNSTSFSMILPHNYNQMLFNQLYPTMSHRPDEMAMRMIYYERVLDADVSVLLSRKPHPKSVDETIRLRRQIRHHIENNLELSQLQARRLFHRYLECVLMRLATEPPKTSQQEKWILKFITRSESGRIKTPSFIKNPPVQNSHRIHSKDRSALVAKLLSDYLEAYNRDTEAYVDDYSLPGFIPKRLFNDFLAIAQENDLENILTLHTNVTQSLPFISSRGIQAPPPIPTGAYGFLRALPSMVRTIVSNTSIDNYYKSLTQLPSSSATSPSGSSKSSTSLATVVGPRGRGKNEKIMSTSVNLPSSSNSSGCSTASNGNKGGSTILLKRRSTSQPAINR